MTQARMPLYRELFPSGDFPASTAVVAPSPIEGELVEIEAIACVE
jgi:enamine deaminase RidA (YjgF/YER057c/UK114 family)